MLQSCLCGASIDRWSNKPLTGDVDGDEDVDVDGDEDEDVDEYHKDHDDHDEQHQLLSSLVETQ